MVQNNATQMKYTVESSENIRKFMYNDIIARYGNCVRISVNDTVKTFTEYQSRMIVEETKTLSFDIKYIGTVTNEQLLENVHAISDKGTFASCDDDVATGVTFALTSHTVDLTKKGTYFATISAMYNGVATATFFRTITVNNNVELKIGKNSFSTTSDNVAVDTQAQSSNEFYGVYFRLYTPTYNTDTTSLHCANGNGAALIIDKDGKVVKAYAATGEIYTEGGKADTGATAQSNMNEAYLDWYINYKNDAYLLLAPNKTGSLSTDPARKFLNDLVNTVCGKKVVF